MKFKDWVILREGKSEEERRAYNDFIRGKTNKVALPAAPVATGHQAHRSGAGVHDSRLQKQRTRKGQERAWRKDYD